MSRPELCTVVLNHQNGMSTLQVKWPEIAAPAAMRITVPRANPGLFLPMALAVTFPIHITVGMPIDQLLVQQ